MYASLHRRVVGGGEDLTLAINQLLIDDDDDDPQSESAAAALPHPAKNNTNEQHPLPTKLQDRQPAQQQHHPSLSLKSPPTLPPPPPGTTTTQQQRTTKFSEMFTAEESNALRSYILLHDRASTLSSSNPDIVDVDGDEELIVVDTRPRRKSDGGSNSHDSLPTLHDLPSTPLQQHDRFANKLRTSSESISNLVYSTIRNENDNTNIAYEDEEDVPRNGVKTAEDYDPHERLASVDQIALRHELLNNIRAISRATYYEDIYNGRNIEKEEPHDQSLLVNDDITKNIVQDDGLLGNGIHFDKESGSSNYYTSKAPPSKTVKQPFSFNSMNSYNYSSGMTTGSSILTSRRSSSGVTMPPNDKHANNIRTNNELTNPPEIMNRNYGNHQDKELANNPPEIMNRNYGNPQQVPSPTTLPKRRVRRLLTTNSSNNPVTVDSILGVRRRNVTKPPAMCDRSSMSQWVCKKVWFSVVPGKSPQQKQFEYRYMPRDLQSMDNLLTILTRRLSSDLPVAGARYIFTRGGERVERVEQLRDGEVHYVASCLKAGRAIVVANQHKVR
jgi:hypothetical protein